MKLRALASLLIALLCFVFIEDANAQLPEGSKPASTNIRANDCPCILPDLRVVFRVDAPNAGKVQVDLGRLYEMQKDTKGVWTVTTDPQVPGFHYYSLVIDSFRVSDPASKSFYGTGRMSSAIEIAEEGVDFYAIKDVPHGDVRSRSYFSKTTGMEEPEHLHTTRV
jgi:hypothetical protein